MPTTLRRFVPLSLATLSFAALLALIARRRPDLLLGHSHIPVAVRVLGTLWINPGAAGHHGFHERRTVAVARIAADGEWRLYEIDLGTRGTRVERSALG